LNIASPHETAHESWLSIPNSGRGRQGSQHGSQAVGLHAGAAHVRGPQAGGSQAAGRQGAGSQPTASQATGPQAIGGQEQGAKQHRADAHSVWSPANKSCTGVNGRHGAQQGSQQAGPQAGSQAGGSHAVGPHAPVRHGVASKAAGGITVPR
jgi:hypothetical protein